MATHSCILSRRFHMNRGAWQVMGSLRVGHDWATKHSTAEKAHVQAGGYGNTLPHHLSLKAPLSKGWKSSSPIGIRLDHVTHFGQWNVFRNARCHLWAEASRMIVWFHPHPFPMLGPRWKLLLQPEWVLVGTVKANPWLVGKMSKKENSLVVSY